MPWLIFVCLLGAIFIKAIKSDSYNNEISDIILLITGILIFLYTRETYELKEIDKKIFLSQDKPLFSHCRHDTEEMKKRFPGAKVIFKNYGKGAGFEIFYMEYFGKDKFFITSLDQTAIVLEPGKIFPVYSLEEIKRDEICKNRKNLTENFLVNLTKNFDNEGYKNLRLLFYKDQNNLWYYYMYIKKDTNNVSRFGLLNDVNFDF